ncbi:MAG: matrixin family metalloprotease [bacterium]|nr:matrixin family metalloprotease [bacterium]
MKVQRLLAPAALIGGTVLLVAPAVEAWTLLGWSLNLGQRDLRVYNNFSDANANDNQTADDNFPGYFGADMAMWKAAVEWGSRLHADGNGDPAQPGNLGNGGANFDFSWQGNANSAGNVGQNIVSEEPGCNGGVLAVTTSFTNGAGWKMIFYACFNWQDGPDISWPSGGNRFDIQGIGTHELGHSLGLGHSTVSGATMFASVSPATAGKLTRTIEADDRGGVQANYGVASATKPIISGISSAGNALTINGSNFGATNNEVWFTQLASGGNGNPIKVTGVSSPSTTSVTVTVPANAGSGDVLVRKSGGAHANLSNAWPYDASGGCSQTPPPSNYCLAAQNSTGQSVVLGSGGTQSVVADDLVFFGSGMPAGQFGIFITSLSQDFNPTGNGVLCVGSFFRWNAIQADNIGLWFWDPDMASPPDPSAIISAGETWNFQLWYRDPAGGGAGFNFSDGMEIAFCP